MKKLTLILLLTLIGCANDEGEPFTCGCVETTYEIITLDKPPIQQIITLERKEIAGCLGDNEPTIIKENVFMKRECDYQP